MLLICLNHHNEPVETVLTVDESLLPPQAALSDADGATVTDRRMTVSFDPAGVKVFRITPAPTCL
jgi:hypothetical protein